MFRTLLLTLIITVICGCAFAQTYYSWRKQGATPQSNCSGLTGANADLCYQLSSSVPSLWVCDNNGGVCTQSSQWVLVTPMYMNSGIIYTYNNDPIQIGTTGTGTITSTNQLNLVIGNTTEMSLSSGVIYLGGALGTANSGTNFLCLNTSGNMVKSTSACSGT